MILLRFLDLQVLVGLNYVTPRSDVLATFCMLNVFRNRVARIRDPRYYWSFWGVFCHAMIAWLRVPA